MTLFCLTNICARPLQFRKASDEQPAAPKREAKPNFFRKGSGIRGSTPAETFVS